MLKAVIGISGKLCSGKSTLAAALGGLDPRYTREGFAAALKQDVEGMPGVKITDANKNIFRPLLQAYGTAMQGLHGKDYWVRRLLRTVREFDYTHLLIDDVRFPHEIEAMRAYAQVVGAQAFFIRLNIDPETQAERHLARYGCLPDPALLLHPSETALDGYTDFELMWDGAHPLPVLERVTLMCLKSQNVPFAADLREAQPFLAVPTHE